MSKRSGEDASVGEELLDSESVDSHESDDSISATDVETVTSAPLTPQEDTAPQESDGQHRRRHRPRQCVLCSADLTGKKCRRRGKGEYYCIDCATHRADQKNMVRRLLKGLVTLVLYLIVAAIGIKAFLFALDHVVISVPTDGSAKIPGQ